MPDSTQATRPARPTVSVVMCTYNGERFLAEQLDSLLRQTFPFDELIIQDDRSTDGTCRLIEQYRRAHPDHDIRLYRNSENLGFERNFLTAVGRTLGDYVAYCDQDDVWRDDKIEVLMRHARGAAMVYCNSRLIDAEGRKGALFYRRPMATEPDALALTAYPVGYGHQMLFSRDVALTLGRFAGHRVSFDYLTCGVAAATGPVRYVSEPLTYWRRYADAATYSPDSAGTSRWAGYAAALRALRRKDNRRATARYFFMLSQTVRAKDRLARRVARLMSTGRLFDIFCASVTCALHPHRAVFGVRGPLAVVRAFFLPMAFIRDHGRYIVKD